jgi:glucose-6-phosphate 1-epimerase
MKKAPMPEVSTVTYQTNEFGVDYVQINNDHAKAGICLYGGHVTQFSPKTDNRERLWVSPNTKRDASKPIRGGIPICWPWFGDFKLSPLCSLKHQDANFPAHGFLRTQNWFVETVIESKEHTQLVLKPSSTSGSGFNHKADVTFIVTVSKVLTLDLVTKNTGTEPFSYSCALHTYFAVDNIEQTQLEGLSGDYLDKTHGFDSFETPKSYGFVSETDRVHLSTPEKLSIQNGFKTGIDSYGHDSVVVWNPWIEKSVSMQDMTDDGYKHMLCVETAITQLPGCILAPGTSHSLKQVIS